MPLLPRLLQRVTRDPRIARMLHGGFSGLMGRGVALLVSAISLPLTVRYLGKLEYGVWITISSTVIMLSVLDLGIANTLTNLISQAYAEDDRHQARTYFSTAFWLTAGITLLLAAVCGAIWMVVDWGSLLHLTDPLLIHRARIAVGISILFFLVSMPLGLANRALSGYQQVHVANYFSMMNSVLGLVAIVLVMLLHGDLIALMLAYCSAMLTGSVLLNLWLSFWNKPWLKPHPAAVSPEIASRLFRQGFLFFLTQLAGLVVFNSDNLVITHYLGAAEVTPYSIAWRLTSYASLLQNVLIPAAWPAFTEAYQKGDMTWLRQTFRALNQRTLLAVAAAALFIGLAGQPFIRFWAGGTVAPPHLLLWTMAAWAVLVSFTTNQALLLTATGRLKTIATVAVLSAFANLGMSILLVRRIGAEGVILGTILSFALIMVVPQQLELRKTLRGDYRDEAAFAPTEEILDEVGQVAGINT